MAPPLRGGAPAAARGRRRRWRPDQDIGGGGNNKKIGFGREFPGAIRFVFASFFFLVLSFSLFLVDEMGVVVWWRLEGGDELTSRVGFVFGRYPPRGRLSYLPSPIR